MVRLASSLILLVVAVECGTHLDEAWFRWRGGRVPFYFQVHSIEWCHNADGDVEDCETKIGTMNEMLMVDIDHAYDTF